MNWIKTFIPGSDPKGKPILSVLAKRTYTFEHQSKAITAEDQQPFIDTDIYEDPDNPLYSEVIAESDMSAYKLSSDVIVLGKVRTPLGKKAYHLDCEVQVGPLKKSVRAFGNRKVEAKHFRGLTIGDPQPFTEIILGYANAYGGVTVSKDGTVYSYFPNPIGKGFTLKGAVEDESEIQLPNLEDIDSPLTSDNLILSKIEEWKEAPMPVSLGWTRKNSYPRYTYLGVLPEYLEGAVKNLEMAKSNNEFPEESTMPKMDFRFFQGASDGLWGKQFKGDEIVRLKYMDAQFPVFEFQLPCDFPEITLDIGNGPIELKRVLHTIVIDKEKNMLTMLWRGAMEYGGIEELAEVEKIDIEVSSEG